MIASAAALLLAAPAQVQPLAAPAPAPTSLPAPVGGVAGTPVTIRSANGAVTLVVDAAAQDGRLSIRVVAANFGAAPQPFGPGAFTLAADGKPLRLADAETLTTGRGSHASRDNALARAAAAPNIAGFGQRDTTQDDNPIDASSGVPGQKFARADSAGETDEKRRLAAALLRPVEVAPHGHQGGATLTEPVRRGARTLDVAVAFAGDVYRFAIRLNGR